MYAGVCSCPRFDSTDDGSRDASSFRDLPLAEPGSPTRGSNQQVDAHTASLSERFCYEQPPPQSVDNRIVGVDGRWCRLRHVASPDA